MKPVALGLAFVSAAICVVLLVVLLIRTEPKEPVALIRIVDAARKPAEVTTLQSFREGNRKSR